MAVPVRLGHNNATNVTVSVRNVTWGRCYTVKSGNSSRGERLDLTLNHSLARSFGKSFYHSTLVDSTYI